jgi:formate dehydrogenase subunit beta
MKNAIIKIDRCYGDAVRTLLARMMETGIVAAAAVPLESGEKTGIRMGLVTGSRDLERARPAAPYFFGNRALHVSRLTRLGPLPEPTAVVLRPCEVRSLVELGKLKQVHGDNLVVLCLDCPGTLSASEYREKKASGFDFHDLLVGACAGGADLEGAREACTVCIHPVLEANADINVGLLGQKGSVLFLSGSPRGDEILGKLGFEEPAAGALHARREAVDRLLEGRKARREAWLAGLGFRAGGIEALAAHFDACEQCRACSETCPACYCKQCTFKLADMETDPANRFLGARGRGAVPLPGSPLLFHLGRMTHMAFSCTGCGACSEACPQGIPVARAFAAAAEDLQASFGYEAGRSPGEDLPLTVYREDELEEKVR